MDLATLANLGEFIGGLVVVVSVVYLAMQVRQYTGAQRTQNYAVALARIGDFQARMSRESEFADILVYGTSDPGRLTRQQRIQFTWAFYEMFGAFEFMFLQTRSGAMPEDVWQRWHATLRWWMSFPGVQAWWRSRPSPFTEAFSRLVDDAAAQGPLDPAANERWVAYLQGGDGR